MFSRAHFLISFTCFLNLVHLHYSYNLSFKKEEYDVENLVSEFGLQFCTIVEIGQGYCTIFAELRDSADKPELRQGRVAEVFLGECECSRLREWELCSPETRDARGEACKFKEATGRDPSAARVHRRLCDFDHMLAVSNKPCDCHKRFDDIPLHPVKGFLTCFRSPIERSLCDKHSVCGVHHCRAETIEGLALVQCGPNCKGKLPFCEDEQVHKNVPVVTSLWSEWSPEEPISYSKARYSEASCLSKNTRAPAFDCLGPGTYCCPANIDNCFCDIEITPTGKKVRRFINLDTHLHFARSPANSTIKVKRGWPWVNIFHKKVTEAPKGDCYFTLNPRSGQNQLFKKTISSAAKRSSVGKKKLQNALNMALRRRIVFQNETNNEQELLPLDGFCTRHKNDEDLSFNLYG